MACSQCGKPAVTTLPNGIELCVQCNYILEQSVQAQHRRYAETLNYLADMVDMSVGIPGLTPRYPLSAPPVIMTGPNTVHNINIQGSVVGAINTGHVRQLEVAMNQIHNQGNAETANHLQQFTQSIVDEQKLTPNQKNEILEILAFLTQQAQTPQQGRLKTTGKNAIALIERILSATSATITTWPYLKDFFEKLF